MTKLAIIDLDGVVADSTERFKRAEEAKQHFADKQARIPGLAWSEVKQKATDLYWQTAFTPELVTLDTLIEGVKDALDTLMIEGYLIIYLTSRPESMRWATLAWLGDHDILHYASGSSIGIDAIGLIMKEPAFQFTKTTVWKAGMVQTFARLYDATEILFIDDEPANRTALGESLPGLWDAGSLAEALEILKGKSA